MAKKTTYKSGVSQSVVDEETGEVIIQTVTTEYVPGYQDVKLPERAKFNNGGFITLFQASLVTIARNYKKYFTKDEGAVLFYLIGTAGIGNSINIDYQELVDELGIQRTNAVTAIKSLERKNIIILMKKGSRMKGRAHEMNITMNFDQLNYHLAYNGKIKEFGKIKHGHPELNIEENNTNQLGMFDV
jgi:hypothetical protein